MVLPGASQGHDMLTDRSALAFFDDAEFAPRSRSSAVVRPMPVAHAVASPVANPVALPQTAYAYAPSYGQGGVRQRGSAALVAFGAMATLFSALVWMNVHPHHQHQHRVMALDVKLDTTPPKQQPKPPEPKPEAPAAHVPTPQQPVVIEQTPQIAVALSPAPAAPAPAPAPVVAAPAVVAPPAPAPAPRPAAPAEVGDLSSKMLSFTPPTYPLESRRQKEEGTVALSLLLGTDGRVADISIASSSGFARLDKAALDSVRKWRWAPIIRNGEPVTVRGTVRIPFVIKH